MKSLRKYQLSFSAIHQKTIWCILVLSIDAIQAKLYSIGIHSKSEMIISFRHKGLERFFLTGSKAGIQATHATKLQVLLTALNRAGSAKDMDAPGWNLHQLCGTLKAYWSVKVNGNWRLIFKFDGKDAELVDYQDYH